MSPSLRARWRKWFGGPRQRDRVRPRPTYRPAFDRLEDRVVPSTRVWSGLGATPNWSLPGNWVGNVAPVSGDDLLFPGGAAQASTSNNDFTGSAATFKSITIDASGYTLGGNGIVLGASGLFVNSAAGSGTDTIAFTSLTLNTSSSITNFGRVGLVIVPGIDTGAAGDTLTFAGSGSIAVMGAISDAGSVVLSGPGTVLLQAGGSYAATTINGGVLQLPATLAGPVTVNGGGTLQLQAGAALTGSLLTLRGSGVGGGVVNSTAAALEVSGTTTLTVPITLGSSAAIGVDAGATLTLNGGTALALGANTLTINSAGSVIISTPLGAGGSAGSLAVNTALTTGTVMLSGASGYTGATTVSAGTLDLTGTLASRSYSVTQNATLLLDDAGLTTSPVHVPNTAPISLSGGTLTFVGSATGNETETVGQITLLAGHSNIRVNPAGAGGFLAQLSVNAAAGGSLVRKKGATVNFSSTSTLGGATARLFFTTAPASTTVLNGSILPYATVKDSDFATYNGFGTGIAAFAGYVTNPANLATVANNSVVKLTTAATLSSTTTLAGLVVSGTSLTMSNANVSLTDSSGGLILVNGASVNPLSGALGTLSFGTSEGFVFSNAVSGAADSITTTISGTGGIDLSGPASPAATSLVLDPGTFANAYSGGTYFNSANVSVKEINALGTAASSPITFVGGALTTTGANYIIGNAVTLAGAQTALNSSLTLAGTVTLAGTDALTLSQTVTITGLISGPATAPLVVLGTGTLVLNPQGGVNNYSGGTVLAGATLVLNSINDPLGATTSPLTLVSGTFEADVIGAPIPDPVNLSSANVTLGGAAPNNAPLTFNGTVTLAGANTLQVVAPTTISGAITGSGGLTEQGTGGLVLSGTDTYAGTTTVTAGSLTVTGSLTGAVGVSGGILYDTGLTGPIAVGPGGTVEPLNPGTGIATNGTLLAPQANFSEGGSLSIPISGYVTAGTSYGQVILGNGVVPLVVGGSAAAPSVLTLDLGGLPAGATGQALAAIEFGSLFGTTPVFTELRIINNPYDYAATLQYTATGVNVIITQGTDVNQPPPTPITTLETTLIWTGLSPTSPNWNDPLNWLGDVAPNPTPPTSPPFPAPPTDNADDLIFPAGAAQIATNYNNFTGATFHSITVEAGGYVLNGNALNLQNNLTATEPADAGTPTVTVEMPITLAPSNEDNPFGNQSTTTFVSTYAGTNLVLAGTSPATQIVASGGDLTIDGSGTTTLGDQVAGTYGLIKRGAGTLFLSPANSSGNTYTGASDVNQRQTSLQGGITIVTTNNALGAVSGTGTNVASGATLEASGNLALTVPIQVQGPGVSAAVPGTYLGAIDVPGGSNLTLNNSLTLRGNAVVDTATSTAVLTLAGQVHLANNTLTLNALGPVFVPSSIETAANASTGNVVFNGSSTGSLSLTAANAFTGSLVVNAGTATLSGAGTLSATSIQVGTNIDTTAGAYGSAGGVGTLVLNDGASNIARLSKTAVLVLAGGDFTFDGANNAASTETIASIQMLQGQSFLQMVPGGGAKSSLTLSFDHITQTNPQATVDFYGAGLGGGKNQLIWTNTTARPTLYDNILPWATDFDPSLPTNNVTRNFATYTIQSNATLFFGPLGGGYTLNPASPPPAGNVVVLDAALAGYTPLTIAAATTFGALVLRDGATVTVNPGASLTLNYGLLSDGTGATNGIVAGAGAGADPILNFGNSASPATAEGIVTSYAPLTLSTAIGDGPDGHTSMVFAGVSTVDLAPPTDATGNTYTGGTTIDSGTVLLDSTDNPFGAATAPVNFSAGVLAVDTANPNVGSAVTLLNPFVFAASNAFAPSTADFATKTAGATLALALGSAPGATNTVSLAGTDELAIPRNLTLTINDQVVDGSSAGSLIVTGGGVQPGAGILVLGDQGAASNSYSGGTTLIDQGANVMTLIVDDASALGTGALSLVSGTFAAPAAVTVPNALTLSSANVTLGTAAPDNGALTFSGKVALIGVSQITTTAVPTVFTGALSDSGGGGGGGGGNASGSLTDIGNVTLKGGGSQTGQTSNTGGTLEIDGTQKSSPVPVNQGTLDGTGSVGLLAVSSTGVVTPGTPAAIGTLTAAGANFSDSGTLRLRVAGFTLPGVNYDQLKLGNNALVAGGTSRLVLDLTGLSLAQVQTVTGVILYGSSSPVGNVPVFNEVDIINNPNNYAVELDYTATGLNLNIGLGATDTPVLGLPPAQTSKEYFPLPFSSANGNAITVSDAGANAAGTSLQVSLSVTSGSLTLPAGTPGLTNNGTASLSFSDLAGNVTADLNSLVFQPPFGFTGPVTLTVQVINPATSQLLGPTEQATGTVPITITFIPFAPSFIGGGDVTVKDTNGPYSAPWASMIQGLPPNGSTVGLTFTTTTDSPSLFASNGQPSVSPNGTLTFTPKPGFGGNAAVTVTLNTPPTPPNGTVFSSPSVTFFIHVISTAAPTINDVIIHWGKESASVSTILAYSVQAALAAGLSSHPDVPFQGISAIDLVFNGKVVVSTTSPAALTITGRDPITGVVTLYTLASPIPVPTPAGDTGYTLEWKLVGNTLAAVDGDEAISLSLNGQKVTNPATNQTFSGNYSFAFQVLIGDVNGDGVVDLKDELAITRALAIRYSGIAVLLDLDGDGSITMLDYNIANKRLGNRSF